MLNLCRKPAAKQNPERRVTAVKITPQKKDNKNDSKKSCNDDCCSSCIACFTFIETPFSKNLRLELSYYKANKNPQFQYSDPYLSDRLKEIWQPPKIG